MRRTRWAATALGLLSVLAAVCVLSGCRRPAEEDDFDVGGPRGGKAAEKKPVEYGTATIKGRVTLKGGNPSGEIQQRTNNLLAAMGKKDPETCLSPRAKKTYEDWIIGSNGGVANVVVVLVPEPGYYFAVDEGHPGIADAVKKGKDLKKAFDDARALPDDQKKGALEALQGPGLVNQPHCTFIPHVSNVLPAYKNARGDVKETGLALRVLNTSDVSHNTAWGDNSSRNPGGDEIIKPKIGALEFKVQSSDRPITLKCSVHPWMQAYVWVTDHPFIAVTGEDGTFEFKNVPKEKVRIIAWHEPKEYLNANGEDGEPVDVSAGSEVTKNFEATFK